MNTKINIELNDIQETKYQEWLNAIKILHGSYGTLEWRISNCGIGYNINVFSELANSTLDLTDTDSW